MTIDEAIKHAEEKARDLESTYTLWKRLADEKDLSVPSDYEPCKKCAEEHRQLAEWLKELKKYKEAEEGGRRITNTKEINLICRNKSVFKYDPEMTEALDLAIKALEKDKCSSCKHYDKDYGETCLNPEGTCRVFEYDGYEEAENEDY